MPRRVEWAWEGYVPLGALTIEAGYQGLGKSTLNCYHAARLSRGELAGDLEGQPCTVVIASSEDTAETTLLPRLMAADADLDKVHIVSVGGEAGDMLTIPDDLERLERIVKRLEARVLILDPLLSFVDLDSHNEQKVRRALAPMAQLASRCNLAVIGLMHLNKHHGSDALGRIMGSNAFTALPRSVLLLGAERADESHLHLVHVKSNLSVKGPSLACHVEQEIVTHRRNTFPTSRFEFDGISDATSHDILEDPDSTTDRSAQDDAAEWLIDHLRNGARPTQEVVEAAKKVDINRRTLYRAASRLKRRGELKSTRLSDGEDSRRKVWELVQEVVE
jgi:RecA-family ATPase